MAFRFKQFAIQQDRCAMKLGTDGVLLGAWAMVANKQCILDIGTGTGVIALMLAQRNPSAQITAIEINKDAAEQATENVAASPWADRIQVETVSLQNFLLQSPPSFDLIVSNPPYFSKSFKSQNHSRNTARHTDSLPFETLFASVAQLLHSDGEFCMIAPTDISESLISLGLLHQLFVIDILEVSAYEDKIGKRQLMRFAKDNKILTQKNRLVMGNGRDIPYTDAYRALTKDFYLAF